MPRLRMRDGTGALRTITRVRMRDGGGVLRTIQRIRMRDGGGVLRTVYQYLSLVLSTAIVTGSNNGAASHGSVTSANVTSTLSGGTGPFSYLWQYLDGDATILPNTGTASSTTFSADVPDGLPRIAQYQLQVTDSTGAVAISGPVEIQLYWTDTR